MMDFRITLLVLSIWLPCGCMADCYNVYTPYTKDGDGNIIYLDRQRDIRCSRPGYAIRMFHLNRHSDGDHVQYEIQCCKVRSSDRCDTINNMFTADGDGNVIFLDRQLVSCPFKGYMKYFYLNRISGNRVRYTFTCCLPQANWGQSVTCYNDHTRGNDDGDGNMVYLDRHKPQCKDNYYMNRFNLIRPTHNTIRYNYRCCRLTYANK